MGLEVLIYAWGHTVPMMADALNIEFEKFDTVWEKWAPTEDITYPFGVIKPLRDPRLVQGRAELILERCNRVGKQVATTTCTR